MKTLKETIKEMEELGLVIDRVIAREWLRCDRWTPYEIQFKKEVEQK